jgi:UDPglucose 6-dehydrogenase
MRIAVIGTGYVGLVSGACFSEFGVPVVCVDKDEDKIARLRRGEMPIYEPGLEALVAANAAAGRLSFTTDLAMAVKGADAVFIAVGTPSRRGDGHADLSYVFAAAEEIGRALAENQANDPAAYAVVVTKSTVPVGTGRQVLEILRRTRPKGGLPEGAADVASNPEFLREGSAIEDFMRPDRVVIGADSERACAVMRQLYRPLFLLETPMLFTDIETAELIKYAANAFLATKITFINEIADLCEAVGADVQDVAKGIGLDGRIGRKFLHAGPGFGGSCFPKDCSALVRTAREAQAGLEDAGLAIVETVVRVNEARKRRMADKIIAACGGTVTGKTIAVLGLTFKPNTDDMRDSPSLEILPRLAAAGAVIRAFDPEGIGEAKKLMPDLVYCSDAYQAMEGADALVLLTEWNEFRALDLARVGWLLANPLVIDLRNIYQPAEMATAGLSYVSIGRPARVPQSQSPAASRALA